MSEHEHTNRLIHETSPYLLQHAHNPVDWYSWGEEALARAKAENKPILLSVGYSACHWCHVMERESFEDPGIAQVMNEQYVPIKVDREERPDLDQIYQTVCQMLTGQGGWPLTMFLTPELQPFYAGTYFPPDDRYGRPGFRRVLEAISHHYHTQPDKVKEAIGEIGRALHEINQAGRGHSLPEEPLADAAAALAQAFDQRNGGLGRQPKFPNTMILELFLRHWKISGDEDFLRMVKLALRKMAEGGIYDQLGGGFHRYSVDAQWLVPHFEKMLYDNALLARLYLQGFQATGEPLYERVVEETLHYVQREMTSPEGGFYSTQDADSEGEEGKFFVWTPDEVKAVLGERDAAIVCDYYGITPYGNFEGRATVLSVVNSPAQIASDRGMGAAEVERTLAEGRQRLFEVREGRVKPFRDDKILVSWNGLMISAFADAAKVIGQGVSPDQAKAAGETPSPGAVQSAAGESPYADTARAAAKFVLERMMENGRLKRSFREGRSSGEGFLDDYAFFTAALLDLYEATAEVEWVDRAEALLETTLELFRDEDTGDFYFTPAGAGSLIVRPRQNNDQSIPSAVSVMALNLLRLSALLDRPDLREQAEELFQANSQEMVRNPHGAGNLLNAYDFYEHGPSEIILRLDLASPEARENLRQLYRQYLPHAMIVPAPPEADAPPIVAGKRSFGGELTAYICQNFTCSRPLQSWEALRRELGKG